MNYLINNSHILKYLVPIWAIFSIAVWNVLSPETVIAIAPWFCGAVLVASGVALGSACKAMYSRPEAVPMINLVRAQSVTSVVTILVGLGITIGYTTGILAQPTLDVVRIAWLLCSGGSVLAVTVARLILNFISLLPATSKVQQTQVAADESSVAIENKTVANVPRF